MGAQGLRERMSEQKTQGADSVPELQPPSPETRGGLPAVIEQARQRRRWRQTRAATVALLLITAAGVIGWLWWHERQIQLPAGIAYGNGRLEADEMISFGSLSAATTSGPLLPKLSQVPRSERV